MVLQNPNDATGLGALLDETGGSFAFWMNFDDPFVPGVACNIFDCLVSSNSNRVRLSLTAAGYLQGIVWGNTASGNRKIETSVAGLTGWHNIAFTYNNAGPVALYLDGIPNVTVTSAGTWTNMVSIAPTVILMTVSGTVPGNPSHWRTPRFFSGVVESAAQIALLMANYAAELTLFDLIPSEVVTAVMDIQYTPSSGPPTRSLFGDLSELLALIPVQNL